MSDPNSPQAIIAENLTKRFGTFTAVPWSRYQNQCT